MKILSLIYEYPPVGGGGGAVAAALNQTLSDDGHDVVVVTSAMRDLPTEQLIDGVKVHRTWCWRRHRHYSTSIELLTTLWSSYRKAVQLIERDRPNLIHAHFVFPTGIVACLIARRFKIPYVLTAHGSDIPGYNPDRFNFQHRLLKPLWRIIMREATAVTSPSNFLAGLVKRSIAVPVHVIPNGYTPYAQGSARKRNMILVVSRMFPRKGVQHFIESILDLETDWEIVIAGDGPYLDALRQQARSARSTVRFTGFLDKATLHTLYEQARILVFPSIRENFPVVLLEAMDARCAIITTDAEGCAEVVGDTAIVVPCGAPAEIRKALQQLMNDKQLCIELARKTWERAKLLRWRRIAGLYVELFAHATGAPPPESAVNSSSTGTFPQLLHE